ncbi:tRNA (adenine(58)-N(1))-methyltransferase, mitochondrial isoform X1 [Mixophyes fleayi]|uniref:tRNA (adenine(58)-N(1))-methyltransferase, mitochondrial isoform X1 n=1 Tax=Mixophyes fleayi TaxID=3061075 RepID=UPI003F4DC2ED
MSPLCVGRMMPWLRNAVLCGKLPPAGSAGSFLACRHRVHVQRCVNHSDSQEGHGPAAPIPTRPARPLGNRRSLSPLDRVSQMIAPEFISQEVHDLLSPDEELSDPQREQLSPTQPPSAPQGNTTHAPLQDDGDLSPPQGTPFKPGDLVLAEYKRRHYSMFKKMFVLKSSGKLVSNWGAISSLDIVGKLPGQKLLTSTGHQFLLKRPSLEEFVTYMKRGPTISYPKDMTAMMMMMDVSPGDVVLEAGSGSGALSLFLSRAVGSEGCVHSFEVRADHHAIAKNNFLKWKNGWQTRCGQPWPDNVQFINRNVLDTLPDYKSVAFDAAALDMLNPHVALPAIIENLKQGAVCAVYIANITQVIDLLEGIRCCELPLLCEKVVEVKITDWLVAPSFRKDGSISKRVGPKLTLPPENQILEETDDDDDDDEESQTDEDLELPTKDQPFGQMPYIARPLPWQTGHTAFLVQLRKFKPAPEHTGTGDHS